VVLAAAIRPAPAAIMLFLTSASFTLGRFLVGAMVWTLNWAFRFGFTYDR